VSVACIVLKVRLRNHIFHTFKSAYQHHLVHSLFEEINRHVSIDIRTWNTLDAVCCVFVVQKFIVPAVACTGKRGMAPLILNFGTRWR
jgi:hypothetical protein